MSDSTTAARLLATVRLVLGAIFLWAFLDKAFGLERSTAPANAWFDGGSPTQGYLTFGTKGPLKEFYADLAGNAAVDAIFMIGLLGIGVALLLGIGMRIAAWSGATMMVLMWSAHLPPDANPLLDDHIVYALVLWLLCAAHAGRTWGLGATWEALPFVARNRWLQ